MAAVSSAVASPPISLESELREILCRFGDLPVAVPNARFTQVVQRHFDRDLFEAIAFQADPNSIESDWTAQLERRKSNLGPFVGQLLVCVFIRLPGIHYTIEIDPVKRRVVHWEWQVG